MVAMDRLFRGHGRRGNTCFLALTVNAVIREKVLTKRLAANELWQSLTSPRIQYSPFGHPRWGTQAAYSKIAIKEIIFENALQQDLPQITAGLDIHPEREPPAQIRVFHHSDSSTILFGWHHALLDAHRAELILKQLVCAPPEAGKILANKFTRKPSRPLSFLEHLRSANRARVFILQASKPPLSTLPLPPPTIPTNPEYTFIRFSEEETCQVAEAVRSHGLELFPSCFLLAAVCRAFQKCALSRQLPRNPLLVPVPHDARRGGAVDRPTSNDLTVFFFRLEQSSLASMAHAAASLLEQAELFVREGLPRAVPHFLQCASVLPPALYLPLLGSATKGAYASFYFSDIGDSLSQFEAIDGEIVGSEISAPVVDAIHFPPLFYPPGICFVASRRNGCLTITLVSAPGILSKKEIESLINDLRADLLQLRSSCSPPTMRESGA